MSRELAQNIVDVSYKKRMAIGVLEKKAGLYQGYIRKLQNGKIKNITLDALVSISTALNVTIDKLIGEIFVAETKQEGTFKCDLKALTSTTSLFLNYIKDKKPEEISYKTFEVVAEIYAYSISNKNNQLDPELAEFILDKHFLSNQT